jgi:catechol 2,3-dioxygenase-like lactoylglutathione lyase family enzyme
MKISAVTLDCADPLLLAAFYAQATGLPIDDRSTEEFAGLRRDDGFFVGFQRVADHQRPSWPDSTPQQTHLDFDVDDLDLAEVALLERGASKPQFQPGGDRWRVLVDPAGHPFCISKARDSEASAS